MVKLVKKEAHMTAFTALIPQHLPCSLCAFAPDAMYESYSTQLLKEVKAPRGQKEMHEGKIIKREQVEKISGFAVDEVFYAEVTAKQH